MVIAYHEFPAGMDLSPLFEGLPNDKCQCPHWGYILKGAIHVRYEDGQEEVIRAGEVYYMPPGHTVWIEEDIAFVEISPEGEFSVLAAHVIGKMNQ